MSEFVRKIENALRESKNNIDSVVILVGVRTIRNHNSNDDNNDDNNINKNTSKSRTMRKIDNVVSTKNTSTGILLLIKLQ